MGFFTRTAMDALMKGGLHQRIHRSSCKKAHSLLPFHNLSLIHI